MKILFLMLFASTGALLLQDGGPAAPALQTVGRLPDGGFLLNSGWTLRPAGEQIPVDTFPMSSLVTAGGRYLLVLNGGYNPPSVSVMDIANKREVSRTPVPDGWLGLAVAPRSNSVYVGGGSKGAVYELQLDPEGKLTRTREFAVSSAAGAKSAAFIGDVAISPDGHLLYAADLYSDRVAVINLQSGQLIDHWKTGRRPYRILVVPGGRRLFVSSWADGSITQLDGASGASISTTRIAPHASDLLLLSQPPPADEGRSEFVARLFVAASNTNNVYSLGVTRDGGLTSLETINLSLTPLHPLGMTPSALAVDKEGAHLFIACSDANAVAVADISQPRTSVRGFVPTGWYPTAVAALPGNQLAILNGKGLGSRANPDGPSPVRPNQPLYRGGPVVAPGYVGHIQTGTVAFLPPVTEEQLPAYTATVRRNSPYTDDLIYGPITDQQTAFFAKTEGHSSPIQHVIYIIKENRTYDQVLGDLEKGNGDKSLNLFNEQITPNLHRLARDFILYDNFYENADVSADGHNWAAAAIAPDYTTKLWPSEYAHRKKTYDFEGGEPANTPPAGYLWNNALQAGISVRNYGEWAENIPAKSVSGVRQIASLRDPALTPHTDMNYRGFDLEYADVDRAREFIREWKEADASGKAAQINIVRLGNDHTSGTRPGALTPLALAADNDAAVGLIVDAVSHSKLWGSTGIFIIEDDAQNGPDHVDSHRAPAWVISPYTQRGMVDSRMYNQASVLRTMELLVGLRPMTHFDAAAAPMFTGFSRQPNPKPFSAIAPTISLTERNAGVAAGAKESAKMDFSHEDRAGDVELNDVLWRAIKHSVPPAPTRSGFVQ